MNKYQFSRWAAKVANTFMETLQDRTEFARMTEIAIADNPNNPYQALPNDLKELFDKVDV